MINTSQWAFYLKTHSFFRSRFCYLQKPLVKNIYHENIFGRFHWEIWRVKRPLLLEIAFQQWYKLSLSYHFLGQMLCTFGSFLHMLFDWGNTLILYQYIWDLSGWERHLLSLQMQKQLQTGPEMIFYFVIPLHWSTVSVSPVTTIPFVLKDILSDDN